MTNDPGNPYGTQNIIQEGEYTKGLRSKEGLPKGLTIFAVLFLIFGVMGVLAFPMTLVGLAMNQFMPKPPAGSPGAEYTTKMLEVGSQIMIPAVIVSFLDTVLAIGFIYSGAQTLRRKESGLKIGNLACMWSFPIEVVRAAMGFYAAYLQQDAFQAFPMGQIQNSPIAPYFEYFLNNMIYLTGCLTLGMTLFRFAYYGFAWSIFRRPTNIEFMLPD